MKKQFYYAGDEKITLVPAENRIAVQFKPESEMSACSESLKAIEDVGDLEQADLVETFHLALLPTKKGTSSKQIVSSLESVDEDENIDHIMPVFQIPGGDPEELMILPQKIRVQFHPDITEEKIEKVNAKHGLKVLEKDELFPNNYLLEVPQDMDALEMANTYHESNLVEYSEPDWIMTLNKLTPVVSDTYYPQQWALPKMNVPAAWQINKGNTTSKQPPSKKVALS